MPLRMEKSKFELSRGDRVLMRPAMLVQLSSLLDGSAKIAMIVLALVIVLTAAYHASYILAPVSAGILLGMTIGPQIDWLERRGVSPYLASGAFVAGFVVVVGSVVLIISAPLDSWSSRIPEIKQKFGAELSSVQKPIKTLKSVEQEVERAAKTEDGATADNPVEVVIKKNGLITEFINTAPDIVARVIIFIGTLFFFAATRSGLRTSVLSFCPTRKARFQIARIVRDTEFLLSRYVATISAVNVCLGLAVGLAMFLLGVPSPYLWGAMAAVVNFVPYVGMIFMTIVIAGVGLLSFDHLGPALLPAAVYLAFNAVEGQFVTPMLLGRNLTLNPLLVFVAIAFWLWLWGPIGAFLAVPILIVAAATIYHLVPRHIVADRRTVFGKPAASVAQQSGQRDTTEHDKILANA
jgi:predicted PurR-regulated permease PerM